VDPRRAFGNEGEKTAADFLSRKGCKIIGRQVRTAFGEIDLVCEDQGEIVFVEVKARSTDEFGNPEAAITAKKFETMSRCAQAYLAEHALESKPWRLDVVAIRGSEIVHFPGVDSPHGNW